MSKGSTRRPENAAAIARNWPLRRDEPPAKQAGRQADASCSRCFGTGRIFGTTARTQHDIYACGCVSAHHSAPTAPLSARYAYIRVEVPLDAGRSLTAGVEIMPYEHALVMVDAIRATLRGDCHWPDWSSVEVVTWAEHKIREGWPGRSYFFEVDIDDGAWVQVFEPKRLADAVSGAAQSLRDELP